MTIRNSLAQFSMLLTTKGGQQGLQGAKTQLSTTVGPNASLWDQNPTAVAGAVFASGPGTELTAFSTKGAGGDPGEVREYKLMVQMVFGFPESFFSDMSATSLATATELGPYDAVKHHRSTGGLARGFSGLGASPTEGFAWCSVWPLAGVGL